MYCTKIIKDTIAVTHYIFSFELIVLTHTQSFCVYVELDG